MTKKKENHPAPNITKAAGLYFLLPTYLRAQTDMYLSYNEQTLLKRQQQKIKARYNKQAQKTSAAQAYQEIISPLVRSFAKTFATEKQKQKQINSRYANFPWYISVAHLVLISYSLLMQDFFLAASFAIYGLLSTWVLFTQPPLHWRFHLQAAKQSFLPWALSLLAVAILIPLVGWLSLDKPPHVESSYALFFAVVFAAPLAEELIFREIFYTAFLGSGSAAGMLNGMALSSFLFALAHFQAGDFAFAFLVYFAAGMILVFLRWIGGSLLFPLLAHALANWALYLI